MTRYGLFSWDHLNTPRLIINATGQAVWRWDQAEPFGSNVPNENPSGLGNFTCNLGFPGQYFDKETNLHYNYFRDYDPAIGRYIQSDPIGLQGGVNIYAYVSSNPLRFADPSGLTLDDMKVILQQVREQFPEINPRGPLAIGGANFPRDPVTGRLEQRATDPATGTKYIWAIVAILALCVLEECEKQAGAELQRRLLASARRGRKAIESGLGC